MSFTLIVVKHSFPVTGEISNLIEISNLKFQCLISLFRSGGKKERKKKIHIHKHQEIDHPVFTFRDFSVICFWQHSQLLYVNRRPCVLPGMHLRLIKCYVTPASVQASFLQRLTSPGARSPPTPPW